MSPSTGRDDAEAWTESTEPSAFAALYDRHANRVFRHCAYQAPTAADAEDLTSLTFLEAWRLRHRIVFVDGSALPWLLAIANNVARNGRRSARRYRAHIAHIAQLLEPDQVPDTADIVVDRSATLELVAAVADAVARLRPAERDVLTLCDISGLSYEAASTILHIPIGTVRSRLSRARQKLRAQWSEADSQLRMKELR